MAQHMKVTWADRTRMPEVASVALAVPAHKDYIVIVRSAVALLGGCFGFTLGEIGDLRLAVDEACNLLVENRPPAAVAGGLECRAEVRGDLLRVTVAAPAEGSNPPDTDSFGWTILTALVDALAWEQDSDTVRVELEKRHSVWGG